MRPVSVWAMSRVPGMRIRTSRAKLMQMARVKRPMPDCLCMVKPPKCRERKMNIQLSGNRDSPSLEKFIAILPQSFVGQFLINTYLSVDDRVSLGRLTAISLQQGEFFCAVSIRIKGCRIMLSSMQGISRLSFGLF